MRTGSASLLSAALALPGLANGVAGVAAVAGASAALAPVSASAETAPDNGTIGFRFLYYRDWQPGAERMKVVAPSLHLLTPLAGGKYALEGSFVFDTMSGASPLYHDTLSGASGVGVNDHRKAGDVKLTRYFDRIAVGAGFAYSTEKDYVSRSFSTDARISSPDNNTTVAFGVGRTLDRIDSENRVARGERKRGTDVLLGITRALTPRDIVQSNITYVFGHGYYNDPYKAIDIRPDRREQLAWLTRWHHHFEQSDATLRLSARFYRDTWGIRAIALNAEYVQPYGAWSLTPSFRYYAQSAADFYRGPPFPQGFVFGQPYSADQRLSGFGAMTPGIRIARSFDGWRADVKVEYYHQRNDWRRLVPGDDYRDVKPMKAMFYQLGMSRDF